MIKYKKVCMFEYNKIRNPYGKFLKIMIADWKNDCCKKTHGSYGKP
jgi:hypothetical protein